MVGLLSTAGLYRAKVEQQKGISDRERGLCLQGTALTQKVRIFRSQLTDDICTNPKRKSTVCNH